MNIDNVNNIDPKRGIDRNQQAERTRPERAGRAESGKEQKAVPVKPETDTVTKSTESRYIQELAAAAERMEEEPRPEAVDRARERMQAGEYNTPEKMKQIAASLLNIDILTD
jgi:hypothetical protein